MLSDAYAFSSFSVDDLAKAKEFYGEILGLGVEEDSEMGLVRLHLKSGGEVMIYPKDNHEAATYTVLNFAVGDIDEVVDKLVAKGVTLERYEGFKQDDKGIARSKETGMGPDIAWFKDPAGNILAVLAGEGPGK